MSRDSGTGETGESSLSMFCGKQVHPCSSPKLIFRRQILWKLIVKPIVMEPLPEVHGYRWRGELNGGAVLEGTQNYLWCRGPNPWV